MKIAYQLVYVCLFLFPLSHARAEHKPGTNTKGTPGAVHPTGAPAPDDAKDFAFPCPLGPKDKTPALKLIMLQPNLAEDKTLQKDLLKKAASGTLHFAIEDYRGKTPADYLKQLPGVDLKKARLFIHEDGFIPGLIQAASCYVSAERFAHDFVEMKKLLPGKDERENQDLLVRLAQIKNGFEGGKYDMLGGFVDNDYLVEAWKRIPRPRLNAKEEALAAEIDAVIAKRDNTNELRTAVRAMQRKPVWGDGGSWIALQKELANAYLSLAENKYKERKRLPDMATLRAVIADPHSRQKENAFGDAIMFGFAARRTAENLGRLYCEAIKEKKELHATVSPLYFQAVLAMVTASGGDKLNLKFRQGGHDFEMKEGLPVDVTPFPEPQVIDPTVIPAPVVDPSRNPEP